jgi:hypothetical protein
MRVTLAIIRRSEKRWLNLGRILNQFLNCPHTLTQSAGHRWRLTLQRLMLPPKIIPRYEQSLHGLVVAQALAVAVGQSSEAPQAHAEREIESLNMRRAYPVVFWLTEDRQFLSAYYPGPPPHLSK